MMALDARNNSALFKRAEQLKRWEESDTNQATTVPKTAYARKVKFSAGCVFLAACMAGDKDEVLRLLEQENADINTCNVDGLTALHQACIDDNLDMVEFLVEHGADVNRADNEGWTPLHATASCGFVSIARYLIESGADLATVSSDGELPIDLSTSNNMEDMLQKHIDEQEIDCEEARSREERMMMSDAKRWLRSDASEVDRPHPRTGATALHVAAAKGYNHVLSLLLAGRANVDKQDNDGWTPLHAAAHWGQKEAAHMLITALADIDTKNFAGQTAIDVADGSLARYLEEIRKKKNKRRPGSQIRIQDNMDANNETPSKVIRVEVKPELKDEERPKVPSEQNRPEIIEEDSNTWRRPGVPPSKARGRPESPPKTQVADKEVQPSDSEVILRRTQSFEHDEKFYQKYRELRARIKANSCPVLPATPTKGVGGGGPKGGRVDGAGSGGGNTGVVVNTNPSQTYSVQRSASLKDYRQIRKTPVSPPQSPTTQTPATATSAPVRRSFVPPTRDEESETQRKAHAKRVRETRRSTQGVTLDEIKSAEELVKKKNLNNNNSSANFKLEEVTSSSEVPVTGSSPTSTVAPTVQRRPNSVISGTAATTTTTVTLNPRPVSVPLIPSSAEVQQNDRSPSKGSNNDELVRRFKNSDDKENDKENDSRSVQSIQAVIQRRRRPKRRSTGVVHVDMDEIDPERQESPGDDDDKESGNDQPSTKSRLQSSSSVDQSESKSQVGDVEENGEMIDYKALYEASRVEIEKLKLQLQKKDDSLHSTKAALERFTNATTKNSLSELEKREKRAMERRMSEMEEELKQQEVLKTENQRLKDENGALIRVISKLSK
uniref:Protein phosphatase 1 regulatory subunit 12B n=1 Tax=Nyssomyia neivai TaxID=330878 RepID=A0A1L8DN71_9DIPT